MAFGLGGVSAGLVLRNKSVEVFEACRGPRGPQFSKIVSVPITHVERAGEVPTAIQQALADAKLKTTRLGVCMAGQDVLLRSFTLPLLPKSEWGPAVQSEARKHIPFRTEDLVWDFYATDRRSAKLLDVVFIGVKAEAFARLEEWLKIARVTPTFIEPQSVSLARVASQTAKGRSAEYYGVVDVERESAHIVIANEQVPYFIRDVNLPTESSRPGLAAEAGVPPTGLTGQESGRLLGSAEPGRLAAGAAGPDPRAEILLNELRLSLDFFTRETPSASVEQLWLFGHEATIGSWCPWLSKQLGCLVELGASGMTQGRDQPVSLHYACAAGTALRELRPARVKISFLGRGEALAAAKVKTPGLLSGKLGGALSPAVRPMALQAAIALLLVIGWKIVGLQQVAAARQQNAQIIRNFPDVGWGLKGKSRAELLQIKDLVKRRLTFLQNTLHQRTSGAQKLDALAKALPDGIWLESVSFSNHLEQDPGSGQPQLIIQGACFLPDPDQEMGAISDLAQRLKTNQQFLQNFSSAEVGEILSMVDRGTQVAYKTFRLDCGVGKH